MKRFVILLFALVISSITVVAQEYEIIFALSKDVIYTDHNGDYFTRRSWIKKYGRKDFKRNFPYPNNYNHVVEQWYTRSDFRETFKTVVGGDIEWSRVFESCLSMDVLKREAISNLDNVTYEDHESISGVIVDRSFIPDNNGRLLGLGSYLWSANVTCEFREGRYKVTLSNVECMSTTTTTTSKKYYSSRYSIGYSVSTHEGNQVWPLANIMYNDGNIDFNEWWCMITNLFDRNFTAGVILSLYEIEEENDW